MPVTTDTLWNMKRLNVWFGVSALLGLVSFCWMMWHDYQRPWRDIQKGYFNERSAIAHFTSLSFQTPESMAKRQELEGALKAANAHLESPGVKEHVAKLEAEKGEIAGKLQGVSLTYGNRNAEVAVTAFKYEEKRALHGDSHPETKHVYQQYLDELAVVEKLKSDKDKLEDELRKRETELKSLYANQAAAKRALEAYEKLENDAARRDQMFGPGYIRTALNLPILDAFPPKDTPGREEVKQVFMPDIRVNYNFTDSYVTDRCTTCHYAIDDPMFSKENFVQQAEAALKVPAVTTVLRDKNKEIMDELARRLANVDADDSMEPRAFINAYVNAANIYLEKIKRPLIEAEDIQSAMEGAKNDRFTVQSKIDEKVRPILAAAPPHLELNGEKKAVPFAKMSDTQQKAYFKSLIAAVNLYLASVDRPQIDFKPVLTAHPRLDLFVSADSPHPMKKMGCTVCHEGSGQDTDFVLAAHTPRNEEEKKEWKKYYVKELGIPLTTFHVVEEFWERPMLLSKYVSASCAKCHSQIYDLERSATEPVEEAANVVQGRELFTRVGCINRHDVQGLSNSRARRHGPDACRREIVDRLYRALGGLSE
ncbi:MAG: hypothetical protein IPK83_15760 [Planctomycetes bacterium]|nr:hypothetical protein [Planctomycetota bacterium]